MLNERYIWKHSVYGGGLLLAAMVLVLFCSHSATAQGNKPLAEPKSLTALRLGFLSPPPSARLRCYWWWLNGHTDHITITHDLEEMKAKGFGGALLVDANGANQAGNRDVPAGPTFGSPAWIDLYTHALREADRLGLEITLNITSGWNLGGPDVRPEDASKLLTWTRVPFKGGKRVSVDVLQPPTKSGFYREIAVLVYPLHRGTDLQVQLHGPSLPVRAAAAEAGFSMPDATRMLDAGPNAVDVSTADASVAEVRDVSGTVSRNGKFVWDAPAGDWEVLRIGYTDSDARVSTSSGTWQGLAIDYLSRDAFDKYWDHTVEPLLDAARPFHSLKYLATDSWELGGTNWTGNFAAEFKQRRGYDPVAWLPVVAGRFIDNRDRSVRFLADLRRTVADLVVSNHYDVFAQRAAQHGLGVQAESGGPHGAPIDALETFRHSAVPQSEFWSINGHRTRDEERFFTKEAASAANIYGQRVVAQEGETSIGPQWSESLATDLKPSFDMAVTEGMNRLVWHEFTSSPASTGLPGQEYFAGTHVNPKVTWWNAGDAFFAYLNRVQFMMQQGTPVDDVLYFTGDNVPSFVRLKADDPASVLPGYDYDATDEDALLHSIRIEGRDLVGPSGVHWHALALSRSKRLSFAVLRFAADYVRAGGVVIGEAPTSATGITTTDEQVEFSRLVARVWAPGCDGASPHVYGAGKVFCTQSGRAELQRLGWLPDVEAGVGDRTMLGAIFESSLDYVHRRSAVADIYFLRNGSAKAFTQDVVFRAHASVPEIWDPVTGERFAVADPSVRADGRTQIRITLPPFGSTLVLFPRQESERLARQPVTEDTQPLKLEGTWTISFQPGRGAPEQEPNAKLESWSGSADPGIRYFSGTATYKARVIAPSFARGEHVLLHFSDVREIARISINGHDAGTVWAKPLTLRVDRWLQGGTNTIAIEVTNLWPNRIIGDLQPGASNRITSTNITSYHEDSALLPSGILGPIEWMIQR